MHGTSLAASTNSAPSGWNLVRRLIATQRRGSSCANLWVAKDLLLILLCGVSILSNVRSSESCCRAPFALTCFQWTRSDEDLLREELAATRERFSTSGPEKAEITCGPRLLAFGFAFKFFDFSVPLVQ